MSKKINGSSEKAFSFLYNILYPACATFAAIVLGMFTVAFLLGENVTEKRTVYTQKYDGETNSFVKDELSIGLFNSEMMNKESFSFDLLMLIGILLFCISVFAMSYLFRMGLSKMSARLLHYGGTLFAFFIFILVFTGYVSALDSQIAFLYIAMALVFATVIYFLCLAIKLLLKRPIAFISEKSTPIIKRYIAPAIAIFTLSVIICAILAFFFRVNVRINEVKEWDPDAERAVYESYETLTTPLAPTLQNYLRYLGSAGVIILSIAVFATKLPKVAKGVLNALICACGFVCLWFIQLDFFHELDGMRLISVVSYASAYIVIFTSVCIFFAVRNRKNSKEDSYESQFSPKRSKSRVE